MSTLLFGTANGTLSAAPGASLAPSGSAGIGNSVPSIAAPNRATGPRGGTSQVISPRAAPTLIGAPGIDADPTAPSLTTLPQTPPGSGTGVPIQPGANTARAIPRDAATIGGATYQSNQNSRLRTPATGSLAPRSTQFPNSVEDTSQFSNTPTRLPANTAVPRSNSPAYDTIGGVGNTSGPAVPGGTGRSTNPSGQSPSGLSGAGVDPSNRATVGGIPSTGTQTPGGAPVSPNPPASAPAPSTGSTGGAAATPQ